MARWVRTVVIGCSAALWLTGLLWILLHYCFAKPTDFGVTPNPLEPTALHIHGIIALLVVFMLGWISGTHVTIRWRQLNTHLHGLILLISSSVLILSGYALYYVVDDSPRQISSAIHQVLGVIVIFIAAIHWRSARSSNP